MPLPTPKLDDRRFQDIVDEAKRLIPRYCPEWTDHNVSDPGVTLIELFAWMTDMLLYRVNQVPEKLYIKFLEMIGVRLDPPRAAQAPVTFYLSAAQPNDIVIPTNTEVATVRTETSPALIFTTEADLTIRPPAILGAYGRHPGLDGAAAWTEHDLRTLALPGQRLPLFSASPTPGDAFYLALERDHSDHVLALLLDCEMAGGAGVDPTNPPIQWQVYQGGAARWAPCAVEHDGTGGFNWSGEVILRTPLMREGEISGRRAYWLRCLLTRPAPDQRTYQVSPDLQRLALEARGGTVGARHATTVLDEVLGQSDGTPGQTFHFLHTPVLARDPRTDHLVVEPPGRTPEAWQEVADFADSHTGDRCYTVDALDGTLTLAPTLLQPDGTVYHFGATPERGSTLRFSRYQYGGGVAGNLPAGTLTVPKSSIPYVAHVTNWEPAVGGRDAQSVEDAKLRAPQMLRSRTRAVTADDYEYLATRVPGVARARCLAPGAQPGDPADPRPGQVFVIVLPRAEATLGPQPAEGLSLSAELRAAVLAALDEHRVVGITLEVREPQYLWVSISASLRVQEGSDQALHAEVRARAEQALYRYLSPFQGGPKGDGWPFGRSLHVSEVYGLLQQAPGVEFVESVQLRIVEMGGSGEPRPASPQIALPRHAVLCSAAHLVQVS